jgi:hypothetical protein
MVNGNAAALQRADGVEHPRGAQRASPSLAAPISWKAGKVSKIGAYSSGPKINRAFGKRTSGKYRRGVQYRLINP